MWDKESTNEGSPSNMPTSEAAVELSAKMSTPSGESEKISPFS